MLERHSLQSKSGSCWSKVRFHWSNYLPAKHLKKWKTPEPWLELSTCIYSWGYSKIEKSIWVIGWWLECIIGQKTSHFRWFDKIEYFQGGEISLCCTEDWLIFQGENTVQKRDKSINKRDKCQPQKGQIPII